MPNAVNTAKHSSDHTRMLGARRTTSPSERSQTTGFMHWPRDARQQRRRPPFPSASPPSLLPTLRRPKSVDLPVAECGDGDALPTATRCHTVEADNQPARPSLAAEPMESMPVEEARSIFCWCNSLARARAWVMQRLLHQRRGD